MEGEFLACTNALVAWLTSGDLIFWLKIVAGAGTVFATIIAVYALVTRSKQARATFLLQLDIRWEGLFEQRKWHATLFDKIEKEVSTEYPQLEAIRKKEVISEKIAKILDDLLKNDIDTYRNFIHLGGFFEIVGLMVDRKYVSLEDIAGLLKGPIILFEETFRNHIDARKHEEKMPEGLFEHASSLAEKTKKKYNIT